MALAFCTSVIRVNSKSLLAGSMKSASLSSFASPPPSSSRAIPRASRVLSALGSLDTLMPLHTTIASARLVSNIAVDSSSWSSLSRDFAVPR